MAQRQMLDTTFLGGLDTIHVCNLYPLFFFFFGVDTHLLLRGTFSGGSMEILLCNSH